MRILMINYEYPPIGAGAANATWHAAHRLAAGGHEVAVLTSRFGTLSGWAADGPVRLYRCPAIRAARERSNIVEMLSWIAGAILTLPALYRHFRPDASLVYFSIPGGPVGLAARWIWGTPYVVSLRGGDVPGSEFTLRWTHRLLTPLRRLVLRGSHAIVANSDGLKALAEKADPYPTLMIPSGVDAEAFSPETRPRPDGAFHAIFVGRLHAQKNVVALVEQFAAAARRCPGVRLTLDLVGDGPERGTIEAAIAAQGVAASVSIRGWIPREQVIRAYRDSDCLVNPSIGEGMPNVVLEAMACGLPVVASRVAGNDTLVKDGENGLLFEVSRPGELADALVRLATRPVERRRLGARGREIAVTSYSWESVTQRYLRLLGEAAGTVPSPGPGPRSGERTP